MGRDGTPSNTSEDHDNESVSPMVDQLQEIKKQQAEPKSQSGCETCSEPIYARNTQKKSVEKLRSERDDFDKWTHADSLYVCKNCGRVLSTEDAKSLR